MFRVGQLALLPATVAALVAQRETPAKFVEQLTAIQERLEKESNDDKDATGKMSCWCQTYLTDKQKVVEDMQSQLSSLTHDIAQQQATNSRLKLELSDHQKELSDNQQDLSTATALREKDASKFQEEEQLHVQNIKQLDGAMTALSNSPEAQLSLAQINAVKSQVRALDKANRIASASSPEEIQGVLKQMRGVFSESLKDMQNDESVAAERHSGLVDAKSEEIDAIQARIEQKTRLAAEGGVELARQQEEQSTFTGLLDANVQLVSAMQAACKSSEDSQQTRQDLRQAELTDLADARADLSGMQFLAVAGRRQAPTINPQAEELCLAGHDLLEVEWRRSARSACEKARAGQMQDAAEVVQDIVDELKVAQENATSSAQSCAQKVQAATEREQAKLKDEEVKANVVDSDKASIEEQIANINQQASQSNAAKSAFSEAQTAQHSLAQGIEMTANNVFSLLRDLSGKVPENVATKLAKVQENSEKLKAEAASYDAAVSKQAQQLSSLLDASVSSASRAMIPLRLSRADKEEAQVAMHTEQHHRAHAGSTVTCDPNALSHRAQTLSSQIERLGSVAANFAYASLR